MLTRTVGAVVLWLAAAGLALAQTLPPSASPTPYAPASSTPTADELQTAETANAGGTLGPWPPSGAPLWKQPDSPQFGDLDSEFDHEPADVAAGDVPGGSQGAACRSRPFRVWLSGDYLLWWHKDGPLGAVLVTSGS